MKAAAAKMMMAAPGTGWRWRPERHRGLIIAAVAFVAIVILDDFASARGMGYGDIVNTLNAAEPLVFAALGETLVIVVGGFDLTAGVTVSLVNVLLASHMRDSVGSELLWTVCGIAGGALIGLCNAFFVAWLRLQSVVVTLATMFVVQGATLLVMASPGGQIPASLSQLLTGDLVPGAVPMALVLLVGALVAMGMLKNSRLGTAIFAVGGDEPAARANGIDTRATMASAYIVAGGLYGLAGVLVSAQIGAGDPLVGDPMTLQIFAAVVLGGTSLASGRGTFLGAIFGALILTMMMGTLLVLDVSTYYVTIVESAILLCAVVGNTMAPQSALGEHARNLVRRWRAWRAGTAVLQRPTPPRRPWVVESVASKTADETMTASWLSRWAVANNDNLRLILPSYVLFALVLIATPIVLGQASILNDRYLNSLLSLAGLLAILGLGQGAVILSGGLDMSVPWAISACGILYAGLVNGHDAAMAWALPLVLAAGIVIGLFNGVGVAVLGISPIIMTLATNGILQGLALVCSDGQPTGWASPALVWFMTGHVFGVVPFVAFVFLFVATATIVLSFTAFGRRLYATGAAIRVARLSGVNTTGVVIAAYCISGLAGALVGILMAALNGQAFLAMGDPYLLPSIAVVLVGGIPISGGRGHYLGIFGGCLLLTAVSTLFAGTTLSFAVRDIILGGVVLGAVASLRRAEVK